MNRNGIDQLEFSHILEWCKPAYAQFVAKQRSENGCLDCDTCARFAFNLVTSRLKEMYPKIHFALNVIANKDPEHPVINVTNMFTETDSMFRLSDDWEVNKATLVFRYGKVFGEFLASGIQQLWEHDDDVLHALCIRVAVVGFRMQEERYESIKKTGDGRWNLMSVDHVFEFTTALKNKVHIRFGYHTSSITERIYHV